MLANIKIGGGYLNNLKKGFTLIELLAVIVILAIIALIATPIILNMINDAKKSAAKDSAYGYIEAVENYIIVASMNSNINGYDIGLVKSETCSKNCDKLTNGFIGEINKKVKGTKPTEISLVIENGKFIKAILKINGYKFIYEDNKLLCDGELNSNVEEENLNYIEDESLIFKYNFDNDKNDEITHNNVVSTEYGMYYNGNSSYSLIGQYNKENITYETTFMPFNYSESQHIMSNVDSGGCAIYFENKKINGYCYINGAYRKVSSIEEINIFKYYSVSLTYDGNTLKLYLNGILQNEINIVGKIKAPDYSTSVILGANPVGNKSEDSYFVGIISSSRIYDRALTKEEIEKNYNVDKKKYFKLVDFKIDSEIAKNGLPVYYNLNKNLGFKYINNINFIRNLVSNQYNGIFYNSRIDNKSILFTGNNSYLKIGDIKPEFVTYEVVFEANNIANSDQHIISNTESGGCGLRLIYNKLHTVCHINGSYQDIFSKEIEKDRKYYASITYDGNTLKLYLNGILQSEKTVSGTIKSPKSGTNLMLSYDPYDGYYFNGKIYSTRVYNRGLTENEILNNYNFDKEEFNIE